MSWMPYRSPGRIKLYRPCPNLLLTSSRTGRRSNWAWVGVATAVGYGLREKNDLGIHSELMSDVMMHLMKEGVVTNREKDVFSGGKTVASFALGSRELYEFMDHNPDLYFMPFTKVNEPSLIARNDNMISINTAMGHRPVRAGSGRLPGLSSAERYRRAGGFCARAHSRPKMESLSLPSPQP